MQFLAKVLLFITGFSLLIIPNISYADGGIFYPPNFAVFENGQKAFIYHKDGIENLVVAPSYQGLAKDFIWVMPTPTEPKVFKSYQSIFTKLQEITTPDYSNSPVTDTMVSLGNTGTKESVQIIEEKTIDAYDTVTLKASSETALSNWMKENDFIFPEDLNYQLGDYVNNGWYFVLIKIRTEAQEAETGNLNSGTITPLRFTFKSDKIIYPMKLTKMALDQKINSSIPIDDPNIMTLDSEKIGMDIANYILADYRVENSALDVSWANWLTLQKIKSLTSETGESDDWLNPNGKMFLTKLDSYIYAEKITDDLVYAKSGSNTVYPVPYYKEASYWGSLTLGFFSLLIVFILSPLTLLFIILSLKAKYEEKWKKPAKVLKIIILSIALIIAVICIIDASKYQLFIEDGASAGGFLAFIIVEGFLIFWFVRDLIIGRRNRQVINK